MKSCAMAEVLPPRKSAVSRADLLWLLYALPADHARQAATLLGFRREEDHQQAEISSLPPPKLPVDEREPRRRPPLRVAHFAVIAHQRFPEQVRRLEESEEEDGDGSTYSSLQSDLDQPTPARNGRRAPTTNCGHQPLES